MNNEQVWLYEKYLDSKNNLKKWQNNPYSLYSAS